MKKFIRTIEVEAMQLRWDNWNEMCDFLGDDFFKKTTGRGDFDPNNNNSINLIIPTPYGELRARQGDWIVKHQDGSFNPCTKDTFENTYEPLPTA